MYKLIILNRLLERMLSLYSFSFIAGSLPFMRDEDHDDDNNGKVCTNVNALNKKHIRLDEELL